MKKAAILPVALLGLLSDSEAFGQVINVGAHSLLPDTPGQTIEIRVSGGAAVQGVDFNVQIADGFPTGGTVDGPNITGVDIIGTALNPTIFFGNANAPQVLRQDPQMWSLFTTTQSGTVVANGLLGILTIDTTGWFTGNWTLALGNTQEGPTDFTLVNATITDGSITVVPEPVSSVAVATLLLAGAVFLRRRRNG